MKRVKFLSLAAMLMIGLSVMLTGCKEDTIFNDCFECTDTSTSQSIDGCDEDIDQFVDDLQAAFPGQSQAIEDGAKDLNMAKIVEFLEDNFGTVECNRKLN